MTSDIALLNELWAAVKTHVPSKERLAVAEAFVELFDEYGMAEGLEHETDVDGDLKIAATTFFGVIDKDEDAEYEQY